VRDNCGRMKNPSPKPALMHCKFLTALQGAGGKMSASNPNSAIFMNDTPNQIKKKINSHAFSGGQETLKKYYDEYKKGTMLTGDMKKECIKLLQEYVKGYQEARTKITDEIMYSFMTPRKLEWNGNPNPKERPKKGGDGAKQKK
jgi:tryptophanyl-tRNA synthetase